jgi:hypothetical protein
MHLGWKTLGLLCLLELAILGAAAPNPHGDHAHVEAAGNSAVEASHAHVSPPAPASGGHSHMHGGAPKTVLNEVSTILPEAAMPVQRYTRLPPPYSIGFFSWPGSAVEAQDT